MTEKEIKNRIITRIPGSKIKKIKRDIEKYFLSDIDFIYKGKEFNAGTLGDKIIVDPIDSSNMSMSDDLENILNAIDVKGVKKITKKIRDTAIKLPKKKLKLEDTLNEMTKEEFKNRLSKIPGVEIKKIKKGLSGVLLIDFVYKGRHFNANNFEELGAEVSVDAMNLNTTSSSMALELENILNAASIKDVEKKTKEIKNTATKLPKKTLKLENNIEKFINEIS